MLLGMLITISSLLMIPLFALLFGLTWLALLLGVPCFAVTLFAGARLWGWAIDQGYMW